MSKFINLIKSKKKIIIDFIYSFVAYALPTIVLQFVVQPFIAAKLSADGNGLFISLFNAIKLLTSVLIVPLSNLRLLKKNDVEKAPLINSVFNFAFVFIVLVSLVVGAVANGYYRGFDFTVMDMVKFLSVLLLLSIHDYFMISFRLILNYRKIVIDNILIVVGYGIGMLLFNYTGSWELIFICGYLLGTVYVLLASDLWKSMPRRTAGVRVHLFKQYGELSTSSLLTNTSTYCDRLIIFPMLGGYDVSVYNAAAVVSKAIAVVSTPLRNVLLSYIVNVDKIPIKKSKIKKWIPIILGSIIVVFGLFWGFSYFACKLLYPKYASDANRYIPIIVIAIIIETCGAIMNIALLRFAKTNVQMINSAIKLVTYLAAVVVFSVLLDLDLLGFCIAILLADVAFCLCVMLNLCRNVELVD